QSLDLRRLQRDPAQHHHQGGAGALISSLSPLFCSDRGEGRGEGLPPRARLAESPLTRRAWRVDLSPQAGEGEANPPSPRFVSEETEKMDFDLSEEQRLLKESVDGLLTDAYDFEQRKKYMKEKGGWSKAIWGRLAEQGLLGLPFAEADGGFGAGAVETMIVMEAMGRAMVLEPYLATVVIGGGFLRHGGSAAQKAAHLPGIIDGSRTLAFAQLEKNSRYDLQDVSTSAKKKGDGWVIDGEKFVVLNGETADTLIVTARTKGAQRDANGIGVFLVSSNAKGVAKKSYPTQDGLHAADITFTGVEVGADAAIGDPENGLALVERVVDEARTAMCAEAVGAMDESLKSTVEYLKTRKQFGVPIGSFQTLQHRAADMFVA